MWNKNTVKVHDSYFSILNYDNTHVRWYHSSFLCTIKRTAWSIVYHTNLFYYSYLFIFYIWFWVDFTNKSLSVSDCYSIFECKSSCSFNVVYCHWSLNMIVSLQVVDLINRLRQRLSCLLSYNFLATKKVNQ